MRWVDAINRRIGRIAMYMVFVLIGILLWSSISKTFFNPSLWTVEMAQFVMVTYFIVGGPYSIQLGSNVRMDLFYGSWSPTTKAWVDAVTIFCLLFYLAVLIHGAVASTAYSLGYFGKEPYGFFWSLFVSFIAGGSEAVGETLGTFAYIWDILGSFVTGGAEAASELMGTFERNATAWRPILWPVKSVITFGLILMLLQAIAEFFRDIARIRGEEL